MSATAWKAVFRGSASPHRIPRGACLVPSVCRRATNLYATPCFSTGQGTPSLLASQRDAPLSGNRGVALRRFCRGDSTPALKRWGTYRYGPPGHKSRRHIEHRRSACCDRDGSAAKGSHRQGCLYSAAQPPLTEGSKALDQCQVPVAERHSSM